MRANATALINHLFPDEVPETKVEYIDQLAARSKPRKTLCGNDEELEKCLKFMDPSDAGGRFLSLADEVERRKAAALLMTAVDDAGRAKVKGR